MRRCSRHRRKSRRGLRGRSGHSVRGRNGLGLHRRSGSRRRRRSRGRLRGPERMRARDRGGQLRRRTGFGRDRSGSCRGFVRCGGSRHRHGSWRCHRFGRLRGRGFGHRHRFGRLRGRGFGRGRSRSHHGFGRGRSGNRRGFVRCGGGSHGLCGGRRGRSRLRDRLGPRRRRRRRCGARLRAGFGLRRVLGFGLGLRRRFRNGFLHGVEGLGGNGERCPHLLGRAGIARGQSLGGGVGLRQSRKGAFERRRGFLNALPAFQCSSLSRIGRLECSQRDALRRCHHGLVGRR